MEKKRKKFQQKEKREFSKCIFQKLSQQSQRFQQKKTPK